MTQGQTCLPPPPSPPPPSCHPTAAGVFSSQRSKVREKNIEKKQRKRDREEMTVTLKKSCVG